MWLLYSSPCIKRFRIQVPIYFNSSQNIQNTGNKIGICGNVGTKCNNPLMPSGNKKVTHRTYLNKPVAESCRSV